MLYFSEEKTQYSSSTDGTWPVFFKEQDRDLTDLSRDLGQVKRRPSDLDRVTAVTLRYSKPLPCMYSPSNAVHFYIAGRERNQVDGAEKRLKDFT